MKQSPVVAVWQRIHAAAPERCVRLRGPADQADLDALHALGLPIPEEFLDSLSRHDGEDDFGLLFPCDCSLLPIAEMLSERERTLEMETEYPDIPDLDEDYAESRATIGPVRPVRDSQCRLVFLRTEYLAYALDFDPAPGGDPGQVIRFNPDVAEGWVVCAPSFVHFLAMWASSLEAGPTSAGEATDDNDWLEHWPLLADLPALRTSDLNLECLLSAGRASGQWREVRMLAECADPPLPTLSLAVIDAHAALYSGDFDAGLRALAMLPPKERISEAAVLSQLDLLFASDRTAEALAELSLAIAHDGNPRMFARRGRLHRQLAQQPPFPASPAQAIQWLASPPGRQHAATCHERAIDDLRAALTADQDCINWRMDLADCLLDAEHWDEAAAEFEALVERLHGSGNDHRLDSAQDGLERARARGAKAEQEGTELLVNVDEVIATLREFEHETGEIFADDGGLGELRDALAGLIERDAQTQAFIDADPNLVDIEAENVAQQIVRQLADTPERFGPFADAEIDGPTRIWLNQAQSELQALGFRVLGTVEPLRNTETVGQRVPIRALVDETSHSFAAAWRVQGPFQICEVVDLESELLDGRILITNNSGAANPFETPPGVEQLALPLATPIPQLYETHRRRLQTAGSPACLIPDLDAALALQEKQRLRKREHARSQGWISDAELRSLLGGAYQILGDRVRARLEQLLN